MKKKLLFISHIPNDEFNGVWKKVKSQSNSFIDLGYDVTFVYFENANTLIIRNGNHYQKINVLHRYLYHYYLINNLNISFDVVYLRKPHGGLYPVGLCSLLKHLCKLNKPKVFMEIPTYPFKNESKGFLSKISSLLFDIEVFFSKKYIHKLLVIGQQCNYLYGIKAENISNGVDINNLPPLRKRNKKNIDEIIFLGVANMAFWHGYDRLIKAINSYTGKLEFKFLIVGDTEPEFSRLKKISQGSDKIVFLGKRNASQIEWVLKEVDIGVDSLGRHRSGNNFNSSIKSKEYAAIGLPFMMSHLDDAFVGEHPFIFKCSPTDDDICLQELIEWYFTLSHETSLLERNFAIEKFSWQSIFKNVIKVQ